MPIGRHDAFAEATRLLDAHARPFRSDVWTTEVVPMLANAPQLQVITILRKLHDDHVGQYPDSTRRTLEQRVRQSRAMSGPPKEVFSPSSISLAHAANPPFLG